MRIIGSAYALENAPNTVSRTGLPRFPDRNSTLPVASSRSAAHEDFPEKAVKSGHKRPQTQRRARSSKLISRFRNKVCENPASTGLAVRLKTDIIGCFGLPSFPRASRHSAGRKNIFRFQDFAC